ncbi:ATP-binding protein [Trichlorobacter lovleyi]|uniref:Histidine kinase n=1 Tax=Trichlorobacter lovleyi (strain ATCC BAA-1151 / DSM 17278 / SZ) TaxID=398767 RepID=B3EB45_TRIL1|nr:ATP-binding protein [Trichlorobacter lovleyi]ACD94029.1 histidine kinase [Trichlorobacter lovleyi SZ]
MANFKTSARALEMLGRQQIAGIPTATSELFKNAYDAYADEVEVDYFRHKNCLLIRDNGYGMTRAEFESKWLTIGTDSKYGKKPQINPFSKPERPIMGEKGIGRLAISAIGPQVLILTRALRENETQTLVVSFINWDIFGLPGLVLEDIHIPVYEFEDNSFPDSDFVQKLVGEVVESLVNAEDKIDEIDYQRVLEQLKSFKINPKEWDSFFDGLLLSNNSIGTHFYITPVDESLASSLDKDYNSGDISTMQKMLLGFTNTMNAEAPHVINTAFRDYKNQDLSKSNNLIDQAIFFTPDDCAQADHHFSGRFDEYGQFAGQVTVYNEETYQHEILWHGANGRKTLCGPFNLTVHYLQGTEKDTLLSRDDWSPLHSKTNILGGLYIYRDGIRILPYGDSDYDWLDIEKRRTKSAKYYFFSHRLMMGYIDIKHLDNSGLTEKAGREGFIENKAYRQLRDILINFFLQLANDFFRADGGPKSELWTAKKVEFDRAFKAKQKRDSQASGKKQKFQKALNDFNNNKINIPSELETVHAKAEEELRALSIINDHDELARKMLDLELHLLKTVTSIEDSYRISNPKGFVLSKDLRQEWEAYQDEWSRFNVDYFQCTKKTISNLIDTYKNEYKVELNKRVRLQQAIDDIAANVEKSVGVESKLTNDVIKVVNRQVIDLTREVMVTLSDSLKNIKVEFAKLDISKLGDDELFNKRLEIEEKITAEARQHKQILESVQSQLSAIHWSKDEDGHIITQADINDALENELEELRGQINVDIELSQLGLAVGVIHHEFTSTAQAIRENIKDLKMLSDVNEKYESLYKNLRANFEHLDNYLSLFTPLDRRMYRKQENIPYKDISAFILDIFKERFRRHNIELKATRGFNLRSIFACRSKIYPVFVNIVDNAVYWLKQTDDNIDKVIRLHADDGGFYISNNGPPIQESIKERVFELGYSKKETPNGRGRGMGLHITRDVLKSIGYEVFVADPRDNATVTFCVQKFEGGDSDE